MQLMQKYEVDIDYCPQCKGVWLDRGEMDKIANIQNKYEDAHYQKYHYGSIPKINPLKFITLSKLTSRRLDQTYKLRNFPSTDGPM